MTLALLLQKFTDWVATPALPQMLSSKFRKPLSAARLLSNCQNTLQPESVVTRKS